MKRLLLWFVIVVSPPLIWFVFTDSGRASWHSLISADTRTTNPAVFNGEASPKNDARVMPNQPAPTEPSLRVQMLDYNPSGAPRDKKWIPGLIITDPQGRRSGIESLNETVYQDIPHSSAARSVGPGHAGQPTEMIVVTIKPTTATTYTLDITGNHAGNYRLAVSGVSPTLESITEISQGSVSADTLVHYQIDLTKIKSLPVTANRGMVFGTAKPTEAFVSSPQERTLPPPKPSDPAVLAAAEVITKDPCGYFLRTLKTVPNEKLIRKDGNIQSLSDEKMFVGCEIKFVTNNTLLAGLAGKSPDFNAYEGTELYRLGWRNDNSVGGDGPGTSLSAIESYAVRCLVASDQPAELNEDTGEIIQSETLELTIQCRQK